MLSRVRQLVELGERLELSRTILRKRQKQVQQVQQQQQQQKPQQGAMPPVWELAPRLRKMNQQKLPKQKEKEKTKDITVNDVDMVPQHPLLQCKTQRVKEKASSSRPMKKAKANKGEKENKDAIVKKGRTRYLHGEDLQVHGRDGAALRDGAVPGQPQRHGGNSKDDDIEGY